MQLSKFGICSVVVATFFIATDPIKSADAVQNASLKNSLTEDCLRLQTAAIENARLPTSVLRKYCNCVAEELLGLVSSDEMKSLVANELTPSLEKKEKIVGDHCVMTVLVH